MKPSVTVVGPVFMDVKGFAYNNYLADGRNLGKIGFVHGGVARNVAENMAHLDLPVTFLSSADRNGAGQDIIDRLQSCGIHTEYMDRPADQSMGMWLAIMDENGNLAGSISMMPDLRSLQRAVDTNGNDAVVRSSHVVVELDLNERLTKQILMLCKELCRPVYGIPGNMDVVVNHPEILPMLECFICNNFEADRLFGVAVSEMKPDEVLVHLKEYVNRCGLRSMVVTLGAEGSVYYDASSGAEGYQRVFPVTMADSSGAGDAFFSGTVMGLVRGLPLAEAVICGTKVAAWTIESMDNCCRALRDKMMQDAFFQQLLVQS